MKTLLILLLLCTPVQAGVNFAMSTSSPVEDPWDIKTKKGFTNFIAYSKGYGLWEIMHPERQEELYELAKGLGVDIDEIEPDKIPYPWVSSPIRAIALELQDILIGKSESIVDNEIVIARILAIERLRLAGEKMLNNGTLDGWNEIFDYIEEGDVKEALAFLEPFVSSPVGAEVFSYSRPLTKQEMEVWNERD